MKLCILASRHIVYNSECARQWHVLENGQACGNFEEYMHNIGVSKNEI